ncbi:MAG TPA: AEC family transporter [Anaerolineae bacterium]|nr:AEC family transporter [Anaerolineae bacterium]
MVVIDVLTPIVALIALGFALRRSGFLPDSFFKQANALVYWFGLPALLFVETATATPELSTALRIVVILVLVTGLCIAIGYLAGWRLRLPRASLASFVQGAYRGNLTYVGLPVVLYAMQAASNDSSGYQSLALLAVTPIIPLYNVLAVLVLLGADGSGQANFAQQSGKLLRGVVSNPLIIACVAGIAYAYSPLPLPPVAQRTLTALGQMALPLALLGIGAALRLRDIRAGGLTATAAALIKVAIAPLAGLAIASALGLTGPELQITLLYLAMPTAAASFVMAERMGADGRLASSIVAISTLLAIPALTVVLLTT